MAKPSGPPCPKCGKPSWDNRGNKKNPKAPDFKCAEECKDEKHPDLTYGWWEPKDKPEPAKPAAQATQPVKNGQGERHRWAQFTRVYQRCRDIAVASWKDEDGVGMPVDMVAAAATLFIQAQRDGLTVEPAMKAKPAPVPVQAPPPVEDFPEALLDDADDLPF